ncbi:MAG TPA: integrase [Eubacteriaceae bacterium]|nr:integrase [Eubacteriaceae bacterium]
MKMTDFSVFLTKYLSEYLPGQRNVSPNTIYSYSDTFRIFLLYCQEKAGIRPDKLTMNLFTAKLVTDYLDWLEKERNCSISTRNQRLACIHAFIKYTQPDLPANLMEIQKILGIQNKKSAHLSLSFLSVEAMSELLKVPNTHTKAGRRDLMILTLLYDSGARVQELIDLSVRDIRTESPATITLHGKGRKVRSVPLMNQTNSLMLQYLKEHQLWNRPEKLDASVFFNNRKEKFTRAGITYILNKYFSIAKENSEIVFPDKISPHVLRHTKAMHMLQSNINLVYIRDFLGHVNVSTTEIYAKADVEIKRRALEAAYVKADIPEQPNWCDDKNLMDWLKDLRSR